MELSKAQLTGIVSVIVILSGLVIVENVEETYYEDDKECLQLSKNNIDIKDIPKSIQMFMCNTKECKIIYPMK